MLSFQTHNRRANPLKSLLKVRVCEFYRGHGHTIPYFGVNPHLCTYLHTHSNTPLYSLLHIHTLSPLSPHTDFPLPEVTITTSDPQPGIGGQVELQCSASVVPHLVPQPMLQLVHSGLQSTNTLINSTGLSFTHSVAVDTTSIAGRYLCKVAITEPEINLSVTVVGETQLTLQCKSRSINKVHY